MELKHRLWIIFCLIVPLHVFSQNDYTKYLIDQAHNKSIDTLPVSNLSSIVQKDGSLNYLKPLENLLSLSTERLKSVDVQNYYSNLATLFSFVGDVKRASFEFSKSDSVNQEDWAKYILKDTAAFKLVDFESTLKNNALNNRVVMFNEAHHIPISRIFVASLLPNFKKYGYKYLALEALNGNIDSLNKAYTVGYYTSEPQMFNLIMYAKQLGFKIIKYEPDFFSYKHTPDARDSIQAENIYNVLKKDPDSKIVVLAGYGHIQERIPNHTMASILQQISNIDPVTINLIAFNQYTNSPDNKKLFDVISGKLNVDAPYILQDKKDFDFFENKTYDYNVIFPSYNEKNLRPGLMLLNTAYKLVKCKAVAPFQLVQAYRDNGTTSYDKIVKFDVPADQKCFTVKDGQTDLYLFPGNYFIVYRNADYQVMKFYKKRIE
ncbi:hypothetical protein [Mucilaginibacter sp.]|uniref:hypothetical protein n=1 Tax=Mucilaginibacter sp. TaxID=1882438 RepID=UPI00262CD545|nr:hypothetical protein [Mucilaginibacter sp.]MDB5030153.1 hypothetical protein [Mucilaginibacter sp.]